MKPHFNRRDGKRRAPQQPRDPGNRVHESTSAKGKIRGTARQLVERYLQFAEEARLANDHVASEAFLQSAEHYVRIGKPVPDIENEAVTATRPERAPIAAMERSISKVSIPSARRVPASEPERVTVTTEATRQDAESLRQASIAAKRAAAAAKVEQIALQHGYTLAQLGLTLRQD